MHAALEAFGVAWGRSDRASFDNVFNLFAVLQANATPIFGDEDIDIPNIL